MKNDSGPLNSAFIGGIAFGLAIGAFLFLISPPFAFENYCTKDDGHSLACFREWSLMFAGWATVAGGILAAWLVYRTIVKMNEQIETTNRHQQENLELEIAGRLALARHTQDICGAALQTIEFFVAYAADPRHSSGTMHVHLEAAQKELDKEVLSAFARDIGIGQSGAIERLELLLADTQAFIEANTIEIEGKTVIVPEIARASVARAKMAADIVAAIQADARRFIEKWQARLIP